MLRFFYIYYILQGSDRMRELDSESLMKKNREREREREHSIIIGRLEGGRE